MSTFCGIFPEIPLISADRYDGENLNSTVFFLSHYHTDHIQGLNITNQNIFFSNRDVFFYSSPVTTLILQKYFPCYEDRFRSLSFERPTFIQIPKSNKSITVSAFPAGHCPGSIMILFETDQKTILYTGDFRINIDDLAKYRHFHDSRGRLKKIDKMYLDTTFFMEDYPEFPSRDESAQEICRLIEEWITISKDHVAYILPAVRYGAEFLFMEVFKRLKMPIHINDEMYNMYKYFPVMDSVMTKDREATQIHCNCMGHQVFCNNDNKFVRRIKPTAMYWKDYTLKDNVSCQDEEGEHFYRVAFSSHASYNEITGFLEYLQPDEIAANVSGRGVKERFEIRKMVKEYNMRQKEIVKEKKMAEEESLLTNDYCMLGCRKKRFRL